METPIKTIIYMIIYLISIPLINKFMENRKPFNLKWFLVFYNFLQVIGSFYIFSEVKFVNNLIAKLKLTFKLLIVSFKSNYSFVCQTVDYSEDPLAMRVNYFSFNLNLNYEIN